MVCRKCYVKVTQVYKFVQLSGVPGRDECWNMAVPELAEKPTGPERWDALCVENVPSCT